MTLHPAAYIREPLDYDKGFDVIDSRTGRTLAWRGRYEGAAEVVDQLNRTYPDRAKAPAHDTLVHEIVGWRIAGVAG